MPREPLSAADVITFLNKEKCEHCDYVGGPTDLQNHAKYAHKRREMGDDLRKETLDAYDKAAMKNLQESVKNLQESVMTTSTQSVSTEYADLKREVEKLKQQQREALEKRVTQNKAAIEKQNARKKYEEEKLLYLKDIKNKINADYTPGHTTGDWLRQQVRLYEIGHLSKKDLQQRLGSVSID